MRLPIDVPGHVEAGGYEHNRHKQNYTYMNLAGRMPLITKSKSTLTLLQITRRVRRQISNVWLSRTEKHQPYRSFVPPNLNEHRWLMFSSFRVYSCVARTLTQEHADNIEPRIFWTNARNDHG